MGRRGSREKQKLEVPNLLLGLFIYSFFKWAKPSNSKEQKQAHFFELAASEGPIHLGVVCSQLFKKCFPNLHTDHLRPKSTSSSLRTRKGRALFTEMGLFQGRRASSKEPLLYSVPRSTYPTIFYSSIKSKGSKRVGKNKKQKNCKLLGNEALWERQGHPSLECTLTRGTSSEGQATHSAHQCKGVLRERATLEGWHGNSGTSCGEQPDIPVKPYYWMTSPWVPYESAPEC